MKNDNKTPRLIKIISDAVMFAVFIFIIFMPVALLTITGKTSSPLSYEAEATLPEISFSSYLDGNLTTGVQNWISKSWPLRSTLVLTYNQLLYNIDTLGASPAKVEIPDVTVLEETTVSGEDIEDMEEVEVTLPYDDSNPLYAEVNRLQYEDQMIESTGYRGTAQVVIGKSGVLYENGYINEYLGYSKMYRDVVPETIDEQVEKLEFIQEKLKERGIAFTLVFSPSKAAEYPQAVPDWYKAMYVEYSDYVRPFDMMIERLESSTVNYINSAALYDEVGLEVTFPKTGIHWNKLASFETIKAMIASYEEQTGETIRHITADKLNKSTDPPGFGNPEKDIFGIIYSATPNAERIVDEYYYWPEIYVENEDCDNRINMFIQGGSFTGDFTTYFPMYGITNRIRSVYYNQDERLFSSPASSDVRWKRYLEDCDYVVFECNEQFVRGFGGNAPSWAQADVTGYPIGNRVYESLYDYLTRNG
jgi:hypothetical protein